MFLTSLVFLEELLRIINDGYASISKQSVSSGELAEDLAVAAIGTKLKRIYPMLLHSRATLERKFKSLQARYDELKYALLFLTICSSTKIRAA